MVTLVLKCDQITERSLIGDGNLVSGDLGLREVIHSGGNYTLKSHPGQVDLS